MGELGCLEDVPKVISGEADEYIVTHPGRSQYSQAGGGVSACGIAALNYEAVRGLQRDAARALLNHHTLSQVSVGRVCSAS